MLVFVRNKIEMISAVPGIDAAYLAMDIEEGLEVIWNEVKFSESKDYRAQEKQMSSALDSMISITHPNIVKVKNRRKAYAKMGTKIGDRKVSYI